MARTPRNPHTDPRPPAVSPLRHYTPLTPAQRRERVAGLWAAHIAGMAPTNTKGTPECKSR